MKALIRTLVAAVATVIAAAPAQADGAPGGQVTAVSLMPLAGRAQVVINVRGSVDVKDFMLHHPERVVLDLSGARLAGTAVAYDGVNRGGVTDVRYSQYSPDAVRIVVQLDQARSYTVDRAEGEVRISFDADRPFLSWSSSLAGARALADASSAPAAAEPAAPATDPAPVAVRAVADRIPVEVDTDSSSAATPAPVALPHRFVDQGPEPRITVTWDHASIADVVAGFAAFSGRTIILGKDIKGDVSAEIKDQPWPQAFAAVLATQGLVATEMPGGIIRVDSPSALAALDSLEPLQTTVVRLNYKQAGALAKTVESVLTKNRGRVVADSSSNALVITDTKSRVAQVADFVRGMDIRTPQVSIQAKIIFVDRTDLQQLGLRYDLGTDKQFFNQVVQRTDPTSGQPFDKNVNVIDLGGNSVAGVANASQNIIGSALDVVFSTAIGGYTLTSFLSALEQVNLSDVQAEPLISTLDNQPADILVGDEIPVRVIDLSSQGGATGAPRATVQFKQTGIRLTVTPHVTNNGQILMNLYTERSNLQTVASADLGYTIQKQQSTNQLLVDNGQTAVIGGLTVTTVTKSRSGIPILSRLPVLGNLFSFTSNQEERRDLVILVTPRIVETGPTQ